MSIPSIDTVYAGHRFRSRLEARWAVVFDRISVRWRYETQGYKINVAGKERAYLPDFWLPDARVWCEVKGDPENLDLLLTAYAAHADHGLPESPAGKAVRLQEQHRLLLLGPIPEERPFTLPLHCVLTSVRKGPMAGVHATSAVFMGVLLGTDLQSPVLDDKGNLYMGRDELWRQIASEDGPFIPTTMPIAYQAARMARFEHDETPAA